MKKHILGTLLALLISGGAFAQIINSYHVNNDGNLETTLVAIKLDSKEQVENAISEIKSIEHVIDVNFLYPESNKFVLTMTQLVDAKILIDKLRFLGIELKNESINFDAK